MPIITLPRLLLSLLAWGLLAAAVYLLWGWYAGADLLDRDGSVRHIAGEPWRLYVGVGLVAWTLAGRFAILTAIPRGKDDPRDERGAASQVAAPDGSLLHVETIGPAGAPTLVLTHGWGLNGTAWWYTKHALAARFQLVIWDLPGIGRSKGPQDGKITIDRFAQALGAVVESTRSSGVILVGHSIGGMTTQTFWRTCSEPLRKKVLGMVLVDTTHENPLRTMWLSPLWRALRWPLIEPLLWLTVVASPLAWLMGWQGYLSGSSQLAMRLTGFGRFATRGQVDFTARLACKSSPGIQAKGNLAMFRWKVTELLPRIDVPLLVLVGAKDIVTLPAASALIADVAPDATLFTVQGAGHMGFMERSVAYNEQIEAFADTVFATAPAAGFAERRAG